MASNIDVSQLIQKLRQGCDPIEDDVSYVLNEAISLRLAQEYEATERLFKEVLQIAITLLLLT